MKLPNPASLVKSATSTEGRGQVVRALQIGAGAASAIWLALRLRRELYGPGGTKLHRYSPQTEESDYAKKGRRRRGAAADSSDGEQP